MLFRIHRNEKRRIESTGEAPTWQYYHEVDELLGSHADQSLDMSSLDGSNVAHSTIVTSMFFLSFIENIAECQIGLKCLFIFLFLIFFAEEEVVSIGDSGSENEADENNHSHNENYFNMNGFDNPEKKQKLMVSLDIHFPKKCNKCYKNLFRFQSM